MVFRVCACHDTCVLRLTRVRVQPSASVSVPRVCFHLLRCCSALFLVPPAHNRLFWRSSLLFTPEGSTPFCTAALSNGALPTPSGLSQQYSLPHGDVGRKAKGIQTTHTIRAHYHGLCRVAQTAVAPQSCFFFKGCFACRWRAVPTASEASRLVEPTSFCRARAPRGCRHLQQSG